MLDEAYEDTGEWSTDDDCGCWVTRQQVDGAEVDVHHWIPDDTAAHAPTAECGCGPALRGDAADGVVLFEHWDQDDPMPLQPPTWGDHDESGADDRGVVPADRLGHRLADHVDHRVP